MKKAEDNSNRKLNGIVLDCNASTGLQVYNAIDTFNIMIENNIINANPIKVAYVLFRVNDKISVFDDKAKNIKKYELIRFFDLDEKLKEILYDYSTKKIAIDYIVNENKIIIDEFINKYLKKNNKLLSK